MQSDQATSAGLSDSDEFNSTIASANSACGGTAHDRDPATASVVQLDPTAGAGGRVGPPPPPSPQPQTKGTGLLVAVSALAATLLRTAPLLLGVAVAGSVVIIELSPSPLEGIFWATGLAAIVIAAVWLLGGSTTPERVDPRLHGELAHWWTILQSRVDTWCAEPMTGTPGLDPCSCHAACANARAQCREIAAALGVGEFSTADRRKVAGRRWVTRVGFVEAYFRLHRAEEDLFLVAPEEEVIAGALTDHLRLAGSSIDNSNRLIDRLSYALNTLGGDEYLDPPTASGRIIRKALTDYLRVEDSSIANSNRRLLRLTSALRALGSNDDSLVPPTASRNGKLAALSAGRTGSSSESERVKARFVVRDVRRTINEYRDAQRDGLVRACSNLNWTGLLTGASAFALLVLAMVGDTDEPQIYAALALFLVGAVVGLFNSLTISAEADGAATEEDFGLTQARLVNIPILSGVAALGGVLITAVGVDVLELLKTEGAGQIDFPNLTEIFNLREYPQSVVIAALFGLAPRRLIRQLRAETDSYRNALRRTKAPEGGGLEVGKHASEVAPSS